MFSAPTAVEWFSDASPKLHTATESGCQRVSSRSRRARPIAKATPTARGRCEAMVDVCGITASEASPHTLCRPPEAGSATAATLPSRTARSTSRSGRPACSAR